LQAQKPKLSLLNTSGYVKQSPLGLKSITLNLGKKQEVNSKKSRNPKQGSPQNSKINQSPNVTLMSSYHLKDRYQANKQEIIKDWPQKSKGGFQKSVPSVHLPTTQVQSVAPNTRLVEREEEGEQLEERGSQKPPQVPKVVPQSKQANGGLKKAQTVGSSRRTPPKQSGSSIAT